MSETSSRLGQAALRNRKMTYSALYLAIALVLPFLTGQIPEIGAMLCPMHIPALLCGFVCGWPWGMAVGFISPLLRSIVFGMPSLFPEAVAMAFEMGVYGAAAGFLYHILPKKNWSIYAALLIAMTVGALCVGAVSIISSRVFRTRNSPSLSFWRARSQRQSPVSFCTSC